MNPALLVSTVCVLAAAAASAQTPRDPPKAGDAGVLTMRGCVSGSLLKSVASDPAAVVAAGSASDRYRMIGSKQMRAEIKKANRKYVAVTGRVQAGPKAMAKGTKMGGTSIGIGVTPATSASTEMPYTPTVEVESIDVLAESCDD